MKALNKLIIALVLFSSSHYLMAQEVSVNIGQSTTNSLTKKKPSQITATFPKNDTISNSWLVDGFIELKFNSLIKTYNIGVVGELHKNNLVSKEQDVIQFGVTAEKDYILVDTDSTLLRLISSASLKHSNNKIKDKKEFQTNIGFTFSLEKSSNLRFLQADTRLINIESDFAKLFTLSHNHNFGLGYIGGDEEVLLGDLTFGINLFPLSGFTYKIDQPELLQVSWNINARTPLNGNTALDLDTLQIFAVGFNYKIDDDSSIGISYSSQNGANPYTRLDNQEFENISAKLKLTLK